MPDSPTQNRIVSVALTVFLLLLAGAASSQPYNFPPRLAPGDFIRDSAPLLDMEDRATLAALQKRIYAQTNSPLVVVTIDRMSDFTSHPSEIDAFARAWFNHWDIGSEADNTGILLLVSREDRQAWIELGAAWGPRWDSYREEIMRGMMMPAFKAAPLHGPGRPARPGRKSRYAGDILAAAQALADMAVQGPHGVTPSLGIVAELMTIPFIQTVQGWQALSPRWGLLTLVFGLFSVAASFAIPRLRGALLLSGLVLLLGGFLPILLLLFLPILLLLLPLVIIVGPRIGLPWVTTTRPIEVPPKADTPYTVTLAVGAVPLALGAHKGMWSRGTRDQTGLMPGAFRLTCQPFCGRNGLWLQRKESRHESRSSIDTASARTRHTGVGLATDSDDGSR
ncbi:MAG: TPM domain-containing protein [Candidatus Tectomicrobia bacterium]|nr:TPM domain-containing protein [Candidatus Tectomicrobia bacterium]